MSTTTKIQNKGQVTIPTHVREQAGLSKGDIVEFSYQRGKIVITPKLVIDRSQFPNADGDYTPAQRKVIDLEITKSLEDVNKGRTFGPFATADDMIASMKGELKKRSVFKKRSAHDDGRLLRRPRSTISIPRSRYVGIHRLVHYVITNVIPDPNDAVALCSVSPGLGVALVRFGIHNDDVYASDVEPASVPIPMSKRVNIALPEQPERA